MPFAAGLRDRLRDRGSQVASEFTRGDSLERILDRHLLAVEQMSDVELLTSILLLSEDGKQLSHCAAPNLPRAYCDAVDGLEIGPCAGSCGTAAYLGRPVYVTDIATDPLWSDFRHLALPHGLRSCWSTPIRDQKGAVIGTFAIYHRTIGGPTQDEIDAIDMITKHVADAIIRARGTGNSEKHTEIGRAAPMLKVVADNDSPCHGSANLSGLLQKVERLESLADEMDRYAIDADSEEAAATLRTAAEDSRKLASIIRLQIENYQTAGL